MAISVRSANPQPVQRLRGEVATHKIWCPGGVLVSGDRDLLEADVAEADVADVEILSSRAFLARLEVA